MEWSIQEIARTAGTTSRTLRHYGELGLLRPSRVAANGYRYYDEHALVRLQRILLLRELGLGLPAIADVLDGGGPEDAVAALGTHLELLEQERRRIGRQIASVETTLRKLREGEPLMAEEVLDGFDHTRYEEEVTRRWGKAAYERGDRWWRSLSEEQRRDFQRRQRDIARDFAAAHAAGEAPDGAVAQEITRRQYEWISAGWQGQEPSAEAFAGLGRMYVDDPRFGAHYDTHGEGTAVFVRDAMRVYAERHLD
ncbi:MerR family transcriptional regulator [Streptomyces sp. WMMC500]|uniref:MerR family transcriptional regulator n=1 Tax=Streptomyces sp. WMMC500 TaxID=3015154 RepID=UPI00248B2324|nr:MerR family transcriptional regulator [Streptomyces sp. WMMC500]WBB63332.1 MerR family transcriptional regulator [Streptomyces sp. WMMC500]